MGTRASGACALRHYWLWIVLGAWGAAVLAYLVFLASYAQSAGTQHAPPALHAVSMPFASIGGRHLIVVALHPKCPCSRATATELERILSKYHETLDCVALVYRPERESDEWIESGLIAKIRSLPHTAIHVDVDGGMAATFGMSTSGAVILYSPLGEPRYWGGITCGRGHEGDNLGSDAVAAVLRGKSPRNSWQPVYGCQIQSNEQPVGR